MGGKKSYPELLKDPRWQRKRLEVLEAAGFACEHCEAADKTLHVHHKIYRKMAAPWEYEAHELQALCEDCHATEHQLRTALSEAIAQLDPTQLEQLLGYAEGLTMMWGKLDHAQLRSWEYATGLVASIGRPHHLTIDDLIARREGKTITREAVLDHIDRMVQVRVLAVPT